MRKQSLGQNIKIGLVIVGAAALWIWHLGSQRRAIEGLPQADQQLLYQRTFDELDRYCRPPIPEGLESHCREQADFILTFPECGEPCRTLVATQRSGPR